MLIADCPFVSVPLTQSNGLTEPCSYEFYLSSMYSCNLLWLLASFTQTVLVPVMHAALDDFERPLQSVAALFHVRRMRRRVDPRVL